jgi:hypothetical protein
MREGLGQLERITYPIFEGFGCGISQRHLGPASDTVIMHLDGDHGIEGGSRGRHDGEINTELYGTRGNDVRYCSWTAKFV